MGRVRKAVITAAGLGTRLLPMSKELPKEMLPIFVKGANGEVVLKPLLQALFELLFLFGVREFCFVVGRGKRAIEDHFTPDWGFVEWLRRRGKGGLAGELSHFYEMVERSTILWVNQPEPRGFGHAVLMAEPFVGDEPFFVCAGDTYIISEDDAFLRRMADLFFEHSCDAVLLLQRVEDPRMYGVAVVEGHAGFLRVSQLVEKPKVPPSNLAIMPIYLFKPVIMEALKEISPGVGGEYQLTDGIQRMVERGCRVYGVLVGEDEVRLDIGTPQTYWEAVRSSYEYFAGR